jgi:DNA-binding NarL/FixJ family response regulator
MISILIADDHNLVRTGLGRMLADVTDMQVVGEATTGEEALRFCRELQPDVVLMDVKMPGIGGLEATRVLVRQHPGVRVIAVSACDDALFPARLMQAGAAGFVTKGTPFSDVVQAIRRVMAGQRYLSAEVAEQMALRRFQPLAADSPFEQLSERELQIALMVVNCAKVQEIADKLHLSPKTVNSYRYRVFEKLKISGDVELTRLAICHGLIEAEQRAEP